MKFKAVILPYIVVSSALALGRVPGSTWKFQAEALGGYHGNPLYVPPGDSSMKPGAALLGTVSAKWLLTTERSWELRSTWEGESIMLPGLPQGNIQGLTWNGESRYYPLSIPTGNSKRDAAMISLALRLDATDNAILSNPDRSDPAVPTLGLVESRARISGQSGLGTFGTFTAMSGFCYRNYEESPNLLASLDSHQEEAELGWRFRNSRWCIPEIRYGVKYRRYFEYPARNSLGDTVSTIRKSLLSHGPEFKLGFPLGSKSEFRFEYDFEMRRDLYQGYFNCISHTPGANIRLRGNGKWELGLKGWTTLEKYEHYRVGYNSGKALKQIRYDYIRATLDVPIGRFYIRTEALYRGEENNSASYRYQAPQIYAGVGFNL